MQTFILRVRGIFSSMFGQKKTVRLGIYGEPNTGKTTLANRISMDWLGEAVGTVSEIPHETRTIQRKEKVEVKVGKKKLMMNLLDMPGLATHVDYQEFMKFALPSATEAMTVQQLLSSMKVPDLKMIAGAKQLPATGKKSSIIEGIEPNLEKEELLALMNQFSIKPKTTKKKISKEDARGRAKEATEGIIEAIKWLDKVDTVLVVMDSTKDPYTQVNIMLIGNLKLKKIPIVIVANKTDLPKSDTSGIQDAFPDHPVVSISALTGDNLDHLYETIATHSK